MPREDWRRYAAPAAFLLAATIAILLIRSGLHSGTAGRAAGSTTVPAIPRKIVSAPTTTTAAHRTTTSVTSARFWTVRAGDTFGVISSQSGIPLATIEALNPNVKSTSLFIGQKLRLR